MTANASGIGSKRRRKGDRINLRRIRERSTRWVPVAVVLLTLGVAAAAIYEARRASLSDHDTTRTLVNGHGAFAASTFGLHAQERLAASFEEALAAGAPEGRTYFRIPFDGSEPTWRGAEPEPALGGRIAEAVRAHAATGYRGDWRFAVHQVGEPGGPLVVYELLDTAEAQVAHGFLLDPQRYTPLFSEIFREEPLLPASLSGGRPNSELALVHVLAPDERILFATPGELWNAGTTEPLAPEFGGMAVHASILNPAANDLILGERGSSRLPLLAGLLVLAFATGGVAIALLRRDADLARVRSNFVSSVSHELRTPLAQIRLFLETLRLGRYRTDEQREWILDNIERESFRLAALVDNVLLFTRTERGAAVGSRSPVDLSPYLGSLVEEFAPLAAIRQTRIETVAEPDLYALLDADAFRQVMLNLLDNAIKYGPRGQTVRVSAAAAGERVLITVEDEGPGVHPQERSSIWAPFRRGSDAVESAVAGSGIGLSVVREIVEWHEGSAYVETGAGGGARFVVEIPRAVLPAPDRDALHDAALRHVG